jgi:hypothetical protein
MHHEDYRWVGLCGFVETVGRDCWTLCSILSFMKPAVWSQWVHDDAWYVVCWHGFALTTSNGVGLLHSFLTPPLPCSYPSTSTIQ